MNENATVKNGKIIWKPTPTDMLGAFQVAYGDLALSMALGELYGTVTDMKLEEIYNKALAKVRNDMEKAGQL